jgi:hypothetical protein
MSTQAENTVQLPAPNRAVAMVYGNRRADPTNVAVAAIRNLSPALSPYTDCGMNRTITDHSDHTENPTCSAATDHTRMRRATAFPPAFHAARSSGFQPVIVCDRVTAFSLEIPTRR